MKCVKGVLNFQKADTVLQVAASSGNGEVLKDTIIQNPTLEPDFPSLQRKLYSKSSAHLQSGFVNCCPTLLQSGSALLPKTPTGQSDKCVKTLYVPLVERLPSFETQNLLRICLHWHVNLNTSRSEETIPGLPCMHTLNQDVLKWYPFPTYK